MPRAINGMKECSRCHEVKPVACFHGDKVRPDGLSDWCRECASAYAKTREARPAKVAVKRSEPHDDLPSPMPYPPWCWWPDEPLLRQSRATWYQAGDLLAAQGGEQGAVEHG